MRKKITAFLVMVGLAACHSSHSPDSVIPPMNLPAVILESGQVQLVRNPHASSSTRVVKEAETTIKAVHSWFPSGSHAPKVRLVIYSPTEPEGASFLKAMGTKYRAAGFFQPKDHTVLLIGDPSDPRFWTVLRHEMAHYALRVSAKRELPFWLNEGVATFYESGVNSVGIPIENSERKTVASHYASSRAGLRLKGLLNAHSPKYQDGLAYAQAWAVTRYLFQNHRQQTARWVASGDDFSRFPAQRFVGQAGDIDQAFGLFEKAVSQSLSKSSMR